MLTISDASYVYGSFTLNMNFSLSRGTFTAAVGPSGAGKSTLLNIIAGFDSLSRGTILVDGRDVTASAPSDRPVSMIFQDNNVFAHLSAWNNVALGIAPSLRLSETDRHRVDNALARVGLQDLASRLPGAMSGGERQRVGIARALVREKPVLLLDEPFAALGPALRRYMLHLVKELHSEKALTTIMVTHSPAEARTAADLIMFIDDGVVRNPVPVPEFFKSRDPAILDYLG